LKNPLRVALIQNSAGRDVDSNLAAVEELMAGVGPVDLVALPEVFALRGSDEDLRAGAEPVPGPLTERLGRWARDAGAWLLAGSLIERADRGPFNTSVLFDRGGEIAATYRKMHLFEAFLSETEVVRERDVYRAGGSPVLAELEGWPCGLSVCYDLRFPELFRWYASRGAALLLVPANFTQRTGADHWEVLLRARAIENQCFVAAPNQCGANPATGVESHGHSLVAGPWGRVLGRAGQAPGVLSVTLDYAELESVRKRVPALDHRRQDLGA
jgi:predicted amidohydrolase